MKRADTDVEKVAASEPFVASVFTGLSTSEVEQRIADGLVNKVPRLVTKTIWRIIVDNVFNFFNILLFAIFLLMAVAHYWQGMFFVVIITLNTAIGLTQDIRARKMVDRLQIVVEPRVAVLRNGVETEISVNEVVLSDIITLRSGDQIPADGEVVAGEIDVNESLLTGEAKNITKITGDAVYSGTYVTCGTAKMRVLKIGRANFAESLQERAKRFRRPRSQILRSLRNIFFIIGTIVLVLGTAMIITYLAGGRLNYIPSFVDGSLFQENVKAISGSLVAMVPSGMYLLTSITLAVGVIRLSRRRMLVQEMYCIEMLARADTLCLDKTGTLTDGTFQVEDVIAFRDESVEGLKKSLFTLVSATEDADGTARAIREAFSACGTYRYSSFVSFSSESKYSAVMLNNGRSIVLGAPEFVGVAPSLVKDRVMKYVSQGLRVLVIASSNKAITKGEKLKGLEPLGLLVLSDTIRKDAGRIISWFQDNGVAIKVISGDSMITVSSIAAKVGIKDADKAISLEGVPLEQVRHLAEEYVVFARVTPEQKEALVEGLHARRHVVAMTGDGVNDILALRSADCSIAMAEGAAATRTASHLVALDSDFAALPSVVAEGRRVINNLQRTCSLFLVKTLFAMFFTFVFLFADWIVPRDVMYPFDPQNMYLWEFATIGTASFFLALQPNDEQVRSTFLANIFTMTIPAAVTQVLTTGAYFLLEQCHVLDHSVALTYAVLNFSLFSLLILYRISWPYDRYRFVLSVAYTLICPLLLLLDYLSPRLAPNTSMIFSIDFTILSTPDPHWWVMPIIIILGCLVYYICDIIFFRLHWRHLAKGAKEKA